MLKLSRKQFYKNHFSEIDKYTHLKGSVLHITSALGEEKFNQNNYDTLYVDSTKDLETQVLDLGNQKYDLIVVTDIFEVLTDVYQFVKFFKNFLKKEGKILLTSINPKWNTFFKVFERCLKFFMSPFINFAFFIINLL